MLIKPLTDDLKNRVFHKHRTGGGGKPGVGDGGSNQQLVGGVVYIS